MSASLIVALGTLAWVLLVVVAAALTSHSHDGPSHGSILHTRPPADYENRNSR